MTPYYYIIALLLSMGAVILGDLYVGRAIIRRRSVQLGILGSVIVLILADAVGISLNIFATNPQYVCGVFLFSHQFPLEELILLTFTSYFALIVHELVRRKK